MIYNILNKKLYIKVNITIFVLNKSTMKTFEEILNKVKDPSVKELIQSKVLELNGLSNEISNIYDKSTSLPSAKNESWSKGENSVELIESYYHPILTSNT